MASDFILWYSDCNLEKAKLRFSETHFTEDKIRFHCKEIDSSSLQLTHYYYKFVSICSIVHFQFSLNLLQIHFIFVLICIKINFAYDNYFYRLYKDKMRRLLTYLLTSKTSTMFLHQMFIYKANNSFRSSHKDLFQRIAFLFLLSKSWNISVTLFIFKQSFKLKTWHITKMNAFTS